MPYNHEAVPENEFEIRIFAERYELLSDSFIPIKEVSQSLSSIIPAHSQIFELGLGTGYFASQMIDLGHEVEGIQPRDEMLTCLKEKKLPLRVLAEETLENYLFSKKHDIIVSHSSVFLFTRHLQSFGSSGEIVESLMFQSFIREPLIVFENLFKALSALTPAGRLFINVQNNPKQIVDVGPQEDLLRFEMLDCIYDLANQLVTKHFRSSYRGTSIVVEDKRYCLPESEIVRRLKDFGVLLRRSFDGLWIILERCPT